MRLAKKEPSIPPSAPSAKIKPITNDAACCCFARTIMSKYKPEATTVRPAVKTLRERSVGCFHHQMNPSCICLLRESFALLFSACRGALMKKIEHAFTKYERASVKK